MVLWMAFCLGFNRKVIKDKFQLSAMTFFSFIHSLKERCLESLTLSVLSKIFISWNRKNLPLVFVSVSILDHVSAYQRSEVKTNLTDWSTEEALMGISVWQLSLPSCPSVFSRPNQVIPLVAILQSPLSWTAEETGFHLHRFIFPSLQLKEHSAKQNLKSVAQNKAARSHEGNWRELQRCKRWTE